jgi:hypothetical protein
MDKKKGVRKRKRCDRDKKEKMAAELQILG